MHVDQQVCVDLWSEDNTVEPRFTLRVVDLPKKKATNGPFAIFLVPQGRFVIYSLIYCSHSPLGKPIGFSQVPVVLPS